MALGFGVGIGRRRGRGWITGPEGERLFPFQIGHMFDDGQSHKGGDTPSVTAPTLAFSTEPYAYALCFSSPRCRDEELGVTGVSGRYAQFNSLYEKNTDGSPTFFKGESPASGKAKMLWAMLSAEDGLDPATADFLPLVSNVARSGHLIANIQRGSAGYDDFLADIDAGMALAAAAGKSYGCLGNFISIGRQDYVSDTDTEVFIASLIQLATHKDEDVRSRTGQAQRFKTYVRQNSCHAYGGHSLDPYIAHAMAEAARRAPDVLHMVGQMNSTTVGVHKENVESFYDGAQDAYHFKREYFDGDALPALEPVAATGLGTVTTDVEYPLRDGEMLEFKVLTKPGAPTNFPLQSKGGFRVINPGGVVLTISGNPSIVGNKVRITTTVATEPGAVVTYGDPQRGGNLWSRPTGGAMLTPVMDFEMGNWGLFSRTAIAA
jgi:hypothetical protein